VELSGHHGLDVINVVNEPGGGSLGLEPA
jgi:hypothetical protein